MMEEDDNDQMNGTEIPFSFFITPLNNSADTGTELSNSVCCHFGLIPLRAPVSNFL